MYRAIICTQINPCMVTKELFSEIVERKKNDAYFGSQIKLAMEINISKEITFKITFGDLELVKTMAGFEEKFITFGRSILPE